MNNVDATKPLNCRTKVHGKQSHTMHCTLDVLCCPWQFCKKRAIMMFQRGVTKFAITMYNSPNLCFRDTMGHLLKVDGMWATSIGQNMCAEFSTTLEKKEVAWC